MFTKNFSNLTLPGSRVLTTLLFLSWSTSISRAQITYFDATEGAGGNTFATGGSESDTSWLNLTVGSSADEDQWAKRFFGTGGTVFQAFHNGTTMPELTTQITAVADGTYDVWVFFWDGPNTNQWTISAGLESGNLTTYSFDGPGNRSAPVAASSLTFTAESQPMTTESPRILYGVLLGQKTVSNGSTINVYVDNTTGGGSANRTWYDGVGISDAGTGPPVTPPFIDLGTPLLAVDFNRNDQAGSPTQSLCRVIAGSATREENQSSYSKKFGNMTVNVSRPDDTAFEFRGANGDSSRTIPGGDTSLSFLVSDFIATREGDLDLSIDQLPAGDYIFRSFHLDTFTNANLGFAQGATTTTQNNIEAVMEGTVMGTTQPTALGSSGINSTFIANNQIPAITFSFSHDGTSPATIRLRSTISNGTDRFLLLNGFQLFPANP